MEAGPPARACLFPIFREETLMKTIGVLVVGIGGGMGSHKARFLQSLEGIRLFGAETNEERKKAAEKTFGIPVFQSLDEALEKCEFDAVTVDVPNAYHADIAVRALEAGKAVLCEKPMATTERDSLRMLETARRTGGFLQIGFELHYSLLYKRAKEILDSGEIGELVNITCFYTPGPWGDSERYDWKKDPAVSGGIFCEKLSHYIDFPRWLAGREIREVVVFAGPNVIPGDKVFDNLHMLYRFDGGAVGELTFLHCRAAGVPETADASAYLEAGHELSHTIIGTRGSLFFSVWTGCITVISAYDEKGRHRPYLKRIERYDDRDSETLYHNVRDEITDFVRRIREGLPPALSLEDSFRTMKVCFAAEESARTGQKIVLPG